MVLYRKYRPKTFKEIIGQENIVQILENEIKTEQISHAYLFTGPRGLGKTTLSRLVAKSVNCLNRKKEEAEPCNQCEHCQELDKGHFLDFIELDAASQTGVDNVRENIIRYSQFPPTRGKYKIFVIDECHMLSGSAFNALLKTLEEPPAYVIFILATTEIHKLPETIISRCQRFDFNKVPLDKIAQRLGRIAQAEKVKISPQVLKTIALHSEGCVRDAESLLNQVFSLNGQEITAKEASLIIPPSQNKEIIKFLELILDQDASEAINIVNKLMEEGFNLEHFTTDLIEFLRKVLLVKVKAVDNYLYWQIDEEMQKKIKALGKNISLKKLIFIIEEFVKTKVQFNYSEIPQLPLELAILKICDQKN